MGLSYGFWKYQREAGLENQQVFNALSNGTCIDGIGYLPIKKIIKRIDKSFADFKRDKHDKNTWESQMKGSFQIFTTSQFVRVDVYGAMPSDEINKFIGVMNEFGCPLFDAQIGERFG